MDKYEELERLYYKKKYIKVFRNIIIILIVSVISVVLYLQNTKQKKQQNQKPEKKQIQKFIKKEQNKTIQITKKIVSKSKAENNQTAKIIKPEIKKLTLYPIFPEVFKSNTPKEKDIIKKVVEKKQKKITPKPVVNTQPEIKIIIKTQKEDLSNTITSYNISPNYTQAMQIANIYYKRGNYHKSIIWSKKANKLNPEKSQSWYLFAKNLIKLGKTKQAKQVLVVYLNTYGTDEKIEKLLRSLK